RWELMFVVVPPQGDCGMNDAVGVTALGRIKRTPSPQAAPAGAAPARVCSSRRRFSANTVVDAPNGLESVAMVASPLPKPLSGLCQRPAPFRASRQKISQQQEARTASSCSTTFTKSWPLRCVAHSCMPVERLSAITDPLMPTNIDSEVFIYLRKF